MLRNRFCIKLEPPAYYAYYKKRKKINYVERNQNIILLYYDGHYDNVGIEMICGTDSITSLSGTCRTCNIVLIL